jgi:hypothetical protein
MARRKRNRGDGLRQYHRISITLNPFSEQVRERAVIEGLSIGQWIREAIADRLGQDPVMLHQGNPNFGRVQCEIVEPEPVDPVDSSVRSLWD